MKSPGSTLEWIAPPTSEWIALHYFPTLEFIDPFFYRLPLSKGSPAAAGPADFLEDITSSMSVATYGNI